MELRQIRCFTVLAGKLHFRRAAALLNKTAVASTAAAQQAAG